MFNVFSDERSEYGTSKSSCILADSLDIVIYPMGDSRRSIEAEMGGCWSLGKSVVVLFPPHHQQLSTTCRLQTRHIPKCTCRNFSRCISWLYHNALDMEYQDGHKRGKNSLRIILHSHAWIIRTVAGHAFQDRHITALSTMSVSCDDSIQLVDPLQGRITSIRPRKVPANCMNKLTAPARAPSRRESPIGLISATSDFQEYLVGLWCDCNSYNSSINLCIPASYFCRQSRRSRQSEMLLLCGCRHDYFRRCSPTLCHCDSPLLHAYSMSVPSSCGLHPPQSEKFIGLASHTAITAY